MRRAVVVVMDGVENSNEFVGYRQECLSLNLPENRSRRADRKVLFDIGSADFKSIPQAGL